MTAVQPSPVQPSPVEPSPAGTPSVNPRRPSRTVIVSAWAVPVLVAAQFAMLAVVPVALVVVGTVRDTRLRASGGRAMLGWAALLAATYAVPLVLRAVGPVPGLSLSRSMGPVLTASVVAVSVVVAIAGTVVARRRTPQTG